MREPTKLELEARAFWGASRGLSLQPTDDERQFLAETLGQLVVAAGGRVADMASRRLTAAGYVLQQRQSPPWGGAA